MRGKYGTSMTIVYAPWRRSRDEKRLRRKRRKGRKATDQRQQFRVEEREIPDMLHGLVGGRSAARETKCAGETTGGASRGNVGKPVPSSGSNSSGRA